MHLINKHNKYRALKITDLFRAWELDHYLAIEYWHRLHAAQYHDLSDDDRMVIFSTSDFKLPLPLRLLVRLRCLLLRWGIA